MPAIDYPLTFQMAQLADECYYAAGYADSTFVDGVPKLGGGKTAYRSRQDWLTTRNFTVIINPNGVTDMAKYWGVMTVVGGVLIVALRGTNSIEDLKIDLGNWELGLGTYIDFAAWDVSHGGTSTQVLAHHRFLETYQSVQNSVRQYVQQQFSSTSRPTAIWVIGHSLGGALANICALDLAAYFPSYPVPKVMTFGAPFVGDQAFATLLNSLVPSLQRFELSWDLVTAHPNYGKIPGTQNTAPYVKAGTAVPLTGPDWIQHFMAGYYMAIKATQPHGFLPNVDPLMQINDLTLKIKTADSYGAGTDADISVNVLGINWGVLDLPWHNDFETGAYDTYDLYTMFPSKKPTGKVVQDIESLTFSMSNIGYFDTYSYSWKLAYVDVYVNNQEVVHVSFDTWVGPGEEAGLSTTRIIGA
jgi:pimeloyl-ACP methyl ester carboxylesterase